MFKNKSVLMTLRELTHCFGASIVDFEQVNTSWTFTQKTLFSIIYQTKQTWIPALLYW